MTEPYLIAENDLPAKYISLHTTDRNAFRCCRRRWNFQSALKQNLTMKGELSPNLWFGTGFHFALEDYHGYNRFGNPAKALKAYVDCFSKEELTLDCQALVDIGYEMINHYVNEWLPRRNIYKTLIIDGVPQVEVESSIYIPELSEAFGIPVIYQLKYDRVVTDPDGRFWIQDHKTAASFNISKLETDPQVSAYCWAFPYIYGQTSAGMLYSQYKKAIVEEPRILKNGNISTDKTQNTTYERYLKALKERYGNITFPPKYKEVLDILLEQETPESDAFIRWDRVARNEHNNESEYLKILAEGYEMLNPKLAIYPNPTSDCSWSCNFYNVCLAQDDGSDWEFMINEDFEIRKHEEEIWRSKIQYPQ